MAQTRTSNHATGFRAQKRYITDHDDNGTSVFSSYPETATFGEINSEMDFFVAYANNFHPDMNHSADLANYKKIDEGEQLPLTIPGGVVLRVCNFAPGSTTAMHRTISLDYGIVLEGGGINSRFRRDEAVEGRRCRRPERYDACLADAE